MTMLETTILSAQSCYEVSHTPGVKILDASFHVPGTGPDADSEFLLAHIPGAQRFNVDRIADQNSPLPHMLPSAEGFTLACEELGLSTTDSVIIYDTSGLFGAARAWWMFRTFGHEQVKILDGGLPAWKKAGYPLESGSVALLPRGRFAAQLQPEHVRTRADVLAASQTGAARIIDARSAARFSGEVPEPRLGLRSGHIPGSVNIPLAKLLHADGTIKSREDLALLFEEAHLDLEAPIITSCGSGITACGLALGLHLLGAKKVAVYDGSWAEWGSDPTLPIATGSP